MARNKFLDFVKGVVVIAMGAHHSINYFYTPYLSTKYVHFVSGAFPFLAGFLVTHILFGKNKESKKHQGVGLRMAYRGVRLIILCAVLNIILAGVLGNLAKFGRTTTVAHSDYLLKLLWNGNYREISFSLLMPIGYVLITLGMLMLCRLLTKTVLAVLLSVLLTYCVLGDIGALQPTYYSGYFTLGMLGAICGFIPREVLERFCGKTLLIVIIYSVSLCTVIFIGLRYPIFATNVVATLLLLYSVALLLPMDAWYIREVLVLGRYSLFMYLAQIVILFALRLIFHNFIPIANNVYCGFAGVCVGQLFVCALMEWIRPRSPIVNRVYVALFA